MNRPDRPTMPLNRCCHLNRVPQSERGRVIVQHCISPGVVPTRLVRTSVSGMEDWLECPRRFVFTQRLGLDTAALPGSRAGDSNHGDVQRAVMLGSLVHNMLEVVDISGGKPALEAACAEAQTRLQAPEELVADAMASASAFFDLPLASRFGPSAAGGHFAGAAVFAAPWMPAGPVLELNGEIDLAAPADDDGGWIIADYKVGRKLDPAKYRDQMLIYSTAWWRMLEAVGRCPGPFWCTWGPDGAALHEMNFTPRGSVRYGTAFGPGGPGTSAPLAPSATRPRRWPAAIAIGTSAPWPPYARRTADLAKQAEQKHRGRVERPDLPQPGQRLYRGQGAFAGPERPDDHGRHHVRRQRGPGDRNQRQGLPAPQIRSPTRSRHLPYPGTPATPKASDAISARA